MPETIKELYKTAYGGIKQHSINVQTVVEGGARCNQGRLSPQNCTHEFRANLTATSFN